METLRHYLEKQQEADRRFYDQRLSDIQKQFQESITTTKQQMTDALAASDKAVEKADAAQKAVNTTQNEFRGTLTDQAQTFMPKESADQRLQVLERWKAEISGSSKQSDSSRNSTTTLAILVLTFVMALGAIGLNVFRNPIVQAPIVAPK